MAKVNESPERQTELRVPLAGGLVHPVVMRVKPHRVDPGTPLEYAMPLLLKRKGAEPPIQGKGATTLFQISGMGSNLRQPPPNPHYLKTSVDRDESGTSVTMSVLMHPKHTRDLRTQPFDLLQERQIADTALSAIRRRGEQSSTETLLTKKIMHYVKECQEFYQAQVPSAQRAQEARDFVEGGGVHPVFLATQENVLSSDECGTSFLCTKGTASLSAQGSNTPCIEVDLPPINAAPIEGITDAWSGMGGDPDCVPLELNNVAIPRLNTLLCGITMTERAMLHRNKERAHNPNKLGGGNKTNKTNSPASAKNGIEIQDHRSVCDRAAVLMQRGYSLMPRCIGHAVSSKSRVYIDRFNPLSTKDSNEGCCPDPLGGTQKLDSLSVGRGFSSAHVELDNGISSGPSGIRIPVVALDPVALFHFEGSVYGNNGIPVDVYMRTHSDMNHILQDPRVYGGHLHAVLDNSLRSAHRSAGRPTGPSLLRCRDFSLEKLGDAEREAKAKADFSASLFEGSQGDSVAPRVFLDDFASLDVCKPSLSATSSRVETRNFRLASNSTRAAPETAMSGALPYTLSVHAPPEPSHVAEKASFSPCKDWICGVTPSGTLMLQTDAPPLGRMDQTERAYLDDAVKCLAESAVVTLDESAKALTGCDDDVAAKLQHRLEQVDLSALHAHLADTLLGGRNYTSRDFADKAAALKQVSPNVMRLLDTALVIEKALRYGTAGTKHLLDDARPLPPPSEYSLAMLTNQLRGNQSTMSLVALQCAKCLHSCVKAMKRCLDTPVTPDASVSSATAWNTPKPSWGRTSKLRPLLAKHQQKLGEVQAATTLHAGPRRTCVLLQIQGCDADGDTYSDKVVTYPDRNLGTDPEYFSSSPGLQSIASRSSVRNTLAAALGKEPKQVFLGKARRLAVSNRRKCHTVNSRCDPSNPADPTLNGNKIATLGVEWRLSQEEPFKEACLQINTCSDDRVRTEQVEATPDQGRGYPGEPRKIECNPQFGFHVLQTEM